MLLKLFYVSFLFILVGCNNLDNDKLLVSYDHFSSKSFGNFELLKVDEIYSSKSHNAFTDIEYFNKKFYVVFRDSPKGHVSGDGVIRILVSDNGNKWIDGGIIRVEGFDLRDPKLNISMRNTLTINAVARKFSYPEGLYHHQSYIWESGNGVDWTESRPFYNEGYWLWDFTWNYSYGVGLGFAYKTGGGDHLNLVLIDKELKSSTYKHHALLSTRPNEAKIVFVENDLALSVVRGGSGENGKLGIAREPFLEWNWKDMNVVLASPNLITLPDKRIIAAVRLYEPKKHTSIGYIDVKKQSYNEMISLPSSGDNGYPGLVMVEDTIFVSYYSKNKYNKSAIFVAKIFIGDN